MRRSSYLRKMLHVTPKVSMFDSPLRIKADGLKSAEKITLVCSMSHDSGNFESSARFVADSQGNVDLSNANSVGGSFEGVNPMGLFWWLKPRPDQPEGTIFAVRDATPPISVRLDLLQGHVTDLSSAPNPLDTATVERHFVHSAVQRLQVRQGNVRGTLFYPKSYSRPLPVILDLHGTAGGLNETRAAYLSSNGFAAFSLAFFRFDDLPKGLKPGQISVEYFEEAIDWLLMQKHLVEDGIGVFGSSFGSDLACILASVSPKVRAVIACNGYHMLDRLSSISFRGQQWPTVHIPASPDDLINGKYLIYRDLRDRVKTADDKVFPLERSHDQCKFLFVAGTDDCTTPAVTCYRVLSERLRKAGRGGSCETLVYENLGHPIDPPYFPHCDKVYHKYMGVNALFGGTPFANMKMQQDLWPRVLKFFEENLGKPEKMPEFDPSFFAHSKL